MLAGVGFGAIIEDGWDSYISSSTLGTLTAGGGNRGQSGQPQGNNPGNNVTGTGGSAGGGGGSAKQVGFNATTNGVEPVSAGRGGDGLQWLDGNFYAGGGGGASGNPGVVANAYGGEGGGGTGAGNSPYPSSITASVNSGGGAGGQNGNGGSGIVIIRYPTGSVNSPYDNAINGGTVTEVDGYAYHTFTRTDVFAYQYGFVPTNKVNGNGLFRTQYFEYFDGSASFFDTAESSSAGTADVGVITPGFTSSVDNRSVQWLGYFEPTTSEEYTFFAETDDAMLMWIGPDAIDNYTTASINMGTTIPGPAYLTGSSVNLVAGTQYPIRIQWGEQLVYEYLSMSFETPTITKTLDFTNYTYYNTSSNGF
jgi:hypothetical protein